MTTTTIAKVAGTEHAIYIDWDTERNEYFVSARHISEWHKTDREAIESAKHHLRNMGEHAVRIIEM